MTSSMLVGERRWASARRGGMTVLGKVAVPKPINLPSQKLENHGLDPNVEIVPKGSLSWGSRPSSSTSNPWGSSSASPNADGATGSPHHPSGRPSSGGGLSRPSTAGSDRHEPPTTTTWGPNSRPSSASGVLTSNQSSLASSRPLSAETRPGSSHLSRFAEPVYDNINNNPVAWGPNGTADKLSVPSKANDFSLSSGDFPTLGSEKDNTVKNSEPHDHDFQVRPGSSSGRTTQSDHKSGTVDTWTREGSPYFEDGPHPPVDKWQQGDPHQYMNPNGPPQHYDTWRGPPMNAPPPAGVWYRGPPPPPPAGPPYPPVPHGGYPMEPFPYYHHPQIPPNLANSQSGPPPGPGPRGHHPRSGDFYRPQMPDPFIRPGMPMRPGFYPGPGPYDGYYGPPMGYNPNERDMQFMGMPPGPHGPPPGPPGPHGPLVYNMGPPQNHPELHDPHFRGTGRGSVGNMYVPEQVDSIPPEESRGPYKVLRKRENERDADWEEDNWEQTLEKNDQTRPTFHKNERVNEGPHKSRQFNEIWGNKSTVPEASHDIPTNQKDPSLIEKIEGLNAKARASDVRENPEQKNRLLINPNENPTIAFGTISDTGNVSSFSRQPHHAVRNRADHHNKGRLNNQDNDGWRKKPQILGSDGGQVVSNTVSVEAAENSETSNTDESDGQAQRARMRELAKQRAIQLQKEEEERIKEQKAKALAKLEELNRRTLATADGTTQATEKTVASVPEQENVEGFQKQTGPVIDDSKCEPVVSSLDAKVQGVAQVNEKSQQESVDQTVVTKQSVANANDAAVGNDGGPHRQKHVVNHRQKQTVQTVESSVDKSTLSGSGESVPNQENSLKISSEPTQQKKRNNKSSKNKHKIDDSREADVAIPQNDLNLDETRDKVTNQYNKPQPSRRMPRNPQANNRTGDRFHVGDVAVWAPVRASNKEEENSQDDVALPAKSIQTNLKNKRAEMERYVPKPVAQQQSSSPEKAVLEDVTAVTHVGPTVELKNSFDNNKQNKPVKPHVKTYKNEAPAVVTESNVTAHEWDPSDGWFMPDELPPVEVTFVKDEGGKGKKPAYKNQKSSTMRNQNYDDQIGSEVEIQQTDRPASRENHSSHWQPKPQGYRGSSEVKRDGQQEIRRERKPNSYRPQSPLEDEAAMFDQQHGHGFRKYGGQNDRRKHNPNANRERRQNLHYEYQPVGSNNNSNYKSDASGNAGPRYKERGSGSGQSQGQPRRGGGNFYGRQ